MVDFEALSKLFSVRGKVALVTGAASGIGEAIAYAFASNGGRVFATDIDEAGVRNTASIIVSHGGECSCSTADITRPEDVRRLVNEALRVYGRIDALYVVPGINVRKPLLAYTYDDFDRVVNVNLRGSFTLLKEASSAIARNPEGGCVVVISSIRHLVVEPGQSVYAATKAAVVQLARTLAAELGSKNVRVNAVAPGVVDTPLTAQIKRDPQWYQAYADKTALKRWATVEEVAGPAVFLATPAASYITGSVVYVDGGWTSIDGRFEPKLLG
jgi:NAD(P)-dependent dehydrogenase (short-subunit alcohol dehydrogenase family)